MRNAAVWPGFVERPAKQGSSVGGGAVCPLPVGSPPAASVRRHAARKVPIYLLSRAAGHAGMMEGGANKVRLRAEQRGLSLHPAASGLSSALRPMQPRLDWPTKTRVSCVPCGGEAEWRKVR